MNQRMPFILLGIILGAVLLDPYLSTTTKSFLYALSLTIKSVIVFTLPVVIFGLLFSATSNLSTSATRIIGFVLLAICFSNFIATMVGYGIANWIYHFNLSLITPQAELMLTPTWSFSLPKLLSNGQAMMAGLISGLIFSRITPAPTLWVANRLEAFIGAFLKILGYFIPVFIAGFAVKLQYEGVISTILRDYSFIFATIAIAQFTYIFLWYFILCRFNIRDFIENVKNMIPAGISGFCTMSSAASLPLILLGAEKNTKDTELCHFVVPTSVNAHLMGDGIAIPILAYAVLKNFGIPEPSSLAFLIFAFYFVLAKFSAAGIPGGGIIVMLPVMETYLGFNSDMQSLVLAIYLLYDPLATCANVMGNGAFAKFIDNCMSVVTRRKNSVTIS